MIYLNASNNIALNVKRMLLKERFAKQNRQAAILA